MTVTVALAPRGGAPLRMESVRWSEEVEPVLGSAQNNPRNGRMPDYLLHVLLALVHKEELRWEVFEIVSTARHCPRVGIVLERHVPERELVILTAHRKGGALNGIPGSPRARGVCACVRSGAGRGVQGSGYRLGAHHSREVMGPLCQVNMATGSPPLTLRRSQILKSPPSAPDTKRCDAFLFHDMTFTSDVWASTTRANPSLLRVSQMPNLWSAEHDANTVASVGLHWMS